MIISAPEFGNSWELDFQIINRYTLDGSPLTARDTNWFLAERLGMQFRALSEAEMLAFTADIQAAFGNEITLTDFEGSDWVGAIIGDIDIVESGRTCSYDVSFNFEGIKV